MKRILCLFLCIFNFCFAEFEVPFLSFSDAILSVEKQKVYGRLDPPEYYTFPLLCHEAPYLAKKKHVLQLKKQAKRIDKEILLIIDDSVGMVAHYFHFMEHLIGIWNFLTYHNPDRITRILFAFETPSDHENSRWKGLANETTYHLLSSLFPNATVGLFKDLNPSLVLKANKIYISSRTRSHGIAESAYKNMNGSVQFHYRPERLRELRDKVFDKIGVTMAPRHDRLRITYCKRTTGRILNPTVEDELLFKIAQEPQCQIQVVDFATLSFREQLQIVANTDLFMGVHGNGLTHLLFLPDNATVLEYYQGGESAFFRLFAQLRGIRYYGNSHERWVTESYHSLENEAPFQENVTAIDLETSLQLIRKLASS